MARRVIVACDICGNEPATTEQFTYDGKTYEVDVCVDHGSQPTDALRPFVDAGSEVRAPSPEPRRRRANGRATPDRDQTKAIREWARSNNIQYRGKPLGDRGRIPQEIIDQYNAAH